jgi:mannose-6-phosphate isomerase-like protein (cupin superfamily)
MTIRILLALILAPLLASFGPPAAAQAPLAIKPLAERKVASLPDGALYWRIENFPSLMDAQAAAGPWSLAVQSAGKAWLFTLGSAGGSTRGATPVAEVGPIPRVTATQYLLRINEASAPAGGTTPVHMHPGSEAFYVVAGEQTIRGPSRVIQVRAGHPETGLGLDVPMQVSSTGTEDLLALVMFVVDANRPFSTPATMP